MLSLARSRYTLLTQLVFLAGNGLGMIVGIVYNGKTPDLYPNNAHHKIGWVATVVVCAQVFLSLLDRATGFMRKNGAGKGAYQGLKSYKSSSTGDHATGDSYRTSYDSGNASDGLAESPRSNSVSTLAENRPLRSEGEQEFDEEESFTDVEFLTREPRPSGWHGWVSKMPMGIFRRGSRAFALWYDIVDRVILPLGFVAFCTGIVTLGRFFVRQSCGPSPPKTAEVLTRGAGGPGDLQRAGALDQGRRVLLDRRPHPGQVVRLLWRPRMGMAHPSHLEFGSVGSGSR
ncbi:DUF2427 domain-containing protein [Candidatus Bathyarchaeota archaeon]|nr:DUF2427 domain-containing protein [Candidatus Bathyarchaeota archaeon]